MNIGYLESIFSFLGGLGMFLYGMSIMGDGMQKSAGSKLNKFLRMVTDNRLLAVGLGALITAILHSSGATTVMVVGFVNAGILNLTQAVGVIMGANIGTTITAWMVSLNSLGDAMKVLQPSFFAPLVVAIGAAFLMFSKKKKESLAGEICIGVGLLFVGLTFMSGSVAPYTDAPIFAKAFAVLGRNPILGILVGALVTAIIQSLHCFRKDPEHRFPAAVIMLAEIIQDHAVPVSVRKYTPRKVEEQVILLEHPV